MVAEQSALAGTLTRGAAGRMASGPATPPVALRSTTPRSLWSDAWRRLLRNKLAVAGMAIIVCFWLVALLAPVLAPYPSNAQNHEHSYAGPVWVTGDPRHLLGTDGVGRDELSRLIWGARISMVVGLVPVTITLAVGSVVGMAAGFAGGRTDNLLMRLVDIVFAFPALLLVIIMSVAYRESWLGEQMGGLLLMLVAIAIVGWEGPARLVRGQVLSLKEQEYVTATRAIGAGTLRIMWRHLAPNVLAPLLVSAAFAIPGAIFAEAALSFIGLGIQPPAASWGNLIQDGLASIHSQPVLLAAPAVCIALVLLAFTFLGDGLRDALDPRLNQ